MKNAAILHGLGNTSQDNWFPWLKKELENRGYRVWVPDLPHFDKPNLEIVYNFVKDFPFGSETILVGHSSGVAIILGILQKIPPEKAVKKVVLVAGFIDSKLKPELFKYVSKLDYKYHFPKKWDWQKIKNSCHNFVIFQSSSDPYVQLRHGKMLAQQLKGELIDIPDAQHFSISTKGERFKKFPEILKYI